MPIFDRLFQFVASFGGIVFTSPEYAVFRIILSIFSLLAAAALLWYWVYLEKRYQFGWDWWKTLFGFWVEARASADVFKKVWMKIQDTFNQNMRSALFEAEDMFNEVLNFYFYQEEPLRDRIPRISPKWIPNIERLTFINEALDLMREKIKDGQQVEVSRDEALAILKEFEDALYSMLVIDEEYTWVRFLLSENGNNNLPAEK